MCERGRQESQKQGAEVAGKAICCLGGWKGSITRGVPVASGSRKSKRLASPLAPAESTVAVPTPGSQPPEMLPDLGLRTVM